jgi:hypothetical protein
MCKFVYALLERKSFSTNDNKKYFDRSSRQKSETHIYVQHTLQ